MIRLFSPFDLFYFHKNLLIFFFLMSLFFSKIHYLTRSFKFSLISKKALSRFFFSLKLKSFNKISVLFFLRIFFFLLRINFFSVYSYNFPFSSQVRVVFIASLGFWFIIVFFGLVSSFNSFMYHFIPEGAPLFLTFFLFFIELVRNLIRPLTLMVRLVANILAGHLLIILLSQLVFLFPLAYPLYIVLNLAEIFVSLIQAYIFSTILVLYFSEL